MDCFAMPCFLLQLFGGFNNTSGGEMGYLFTGLDTTYGEEWSEQRAADLLVLTYLYFHH